MTNVHELPDSMQRAWRAFAQALAGALREAATDAEIERALAALKPFYLDYAKPTAITFYPDDPERSLREHNDYVFGLVHSLLLLCAVREIELLRLL